MNSLVLSHLEALSRVQIYTDAEQCIRLQIADIYC